MASVRHTTTARGRGRARLLVTALIGALLLNPPILEIFSSGTVFRPFGWPLVILYINLIWLLLIILVVLPKLPLPGRQRSSGRSAASKGQA